MGFYRLNLDVMQQTKPEYIKTKPIQTKPNPKF